MIDTRKRILFLDDDVNVLSGIRRMMRDERDEWKMEFVSHAADALSVMEDDHYDVVVSDLRMPGMNGVEFLEEVRSKYPETIRFILSGYSEQPLQEQAVMVAHQFVSKPCDASRLKSLITRSFALRDKLKSETVTKVLSKLRNLPVMPDVYNNIINILKTPNANPRQIGEMIASDIGMSAKTLQVTNSAFYGLANEIVDPVHAVVYLGLKTVEALVLTHGVFAELSEKSVKDFFVDGLQSHCFRVGTLTKKICKAHQMSQEDIEVATMAGILHDAGKMVLISQFPDEYREIILRSRAECVGADHIESQLLGVSHAELGGCLLNLWGLPNAIIEAATYHHHPGHHVSDELTVVSAVHAANAIDHQLCSGLGDGFASQIDRDYFEAFQVSKQLKKWQQLHLPTDIEEYENVG